MLIKLHARGISGSAGPLGYNLGMLDSHKNIRLVAPTVLRGNPASVALAIDNSPHVHKYTSGTISFALEENPSEEQIQKIMSESEALWFAGVEDYQARIPMVWILHQDKGAIKNSDGSITPGRVELNFVIPRIDLETGKAFNACPPRQTMAMHDSLVDKWCLEHSALVNPREPSRAQDIKPRFYGNTKPTHESIELLIHTGVVVGEVFDRPSMVLYMAENGFTVNRSNDSTITFKDENNVKVRMKGAMFAADWKLGQRIEEAQIATKSLEKAQARVNEFINQRKTYNSDRYPMDDPELTPMAEPATDFIITRKNENHGIDPIRDRAFNHCNELKQNAIRASESIGRAFKAIRGAQEKYNDVMRKLSKRIADTHAWLGKVLDPNFIPMDRVPKSADPEALHMPNRAKINEWERQKLADMAASGIMPEPKLNQEALNKIATAQHTAIRIT